VLCLTFVNQLLVTISAINTTFSGI